jgi:hypothetical protein
LLLRAYRLNRAQLCPPDSIPERNGTPLSPHCSLPAYFPTRTHSTSAGDKLDELGQVTSCLWVLHPHLWYWVIVAPLPWSYWGLNERCVGNACTRLSTHFLAVALLPASRCCILVHFGTVFAAFVLCSSY